MTGEKGYTGIDGFRLAAAVLVVAIHTSPLLVLGETADFVLTGVIARVAVPFFFMTSGFFLFSGYGGGREKLKGLEIRTAKIYGLAMLFYVPLNVYTGYFAAEPLLPVLLRDVLVDGTVYHLWYLPAAMAGAAVAWGLLRRGGFRLAFPATLALYAVGLLGDSYYGLAQGLPPLAWLYDRLFEVCDYTRNGLFFAPLFFVMGGWFARRRPERGTGAPHFCAFLLALAAMIAEGLLLRSLGLPRHDSMYVLLPVCLFFLFSWLSGLRGRRLPLVRTAALLVYILHPMVLVAVRFAAKLTGLTALLVDNTFVQFLTVTALSAGAAFVLAAAQRAWRQHRPPRQGIRPEDRAWIEVDLAALGHNARALQRRMPEGCELMAVVKAEAYGHGAAVTAAYLQDAGVRAFAVATLEEGIALRRAGVRGEILILGVTPAARAWLIRRWRLVQTAADLPHAQALDAAGVRIRVHLKIDTGMHRLGFAAGDTAPVLAACRLKNLQVCGAYTHLCAADSPLQEDIDFTLRQARAFYALADRLEKEGVSLPKLHLQSSYGLLNYPELRGDYVRAGIALYGCLSRPEDTTVVRPDLRAVLSLRARVALVRTVRAGESVGYGRAFTAPRDMRLAVVSAGYADGVPSALAQGGRVLLHGRYAPLAGRVCMDMLTVDVSAIPEVQAGDVVTLIGEGLPAAQAAGAAGEITNELLSRMGGRLAVKYRE